MSSVIRIDGISIEDVNQNNFFDPGLDKVTDSQGLALPPQKEARELRGILNKLQVSAWRGVPLFQAGAYLESMKNAEKHAAAGGVDETAESLQDALDSLKNTSLRFDTKRGDRAFLQALTQGIDNRFREAQKLAKVGWNIDVVKTHLDTAAQYDNEMQLRFQKSVFNATRADQILIDAYKNGIPNLYVEADHEAHSGELEETKRILLDTQRHILDANRKFNLGIVYDQTQADQTLETAFRKGIPEFYNKATLQALKGQTRNVRTLLLTLQNEIREANQNFGLGFQYDQALADSILENALVFGVIDNYQLASRKAKRRDLRGAQYWLQQADNYVLEYNQKFASLPGRKPLVFDQVLATKILSCAQGNGACP